MTTEPIWLTELDVAELVTLPSAIEVIERALLSEAAGGTASMEKTHVLFGEHDSLHAIGAVDVVHGLVATKTWAHTAGGATPLVVLWRAETGDLEAVVEAFALGQLRTGAVSGVATRHLSPEHARLMAVVGSGRQALAQVASVLSVRPIDHVRVFSPTPAHRERFAEQVATLRSDLKVSVAASVEEAVDGAPIITTVTRAREAFLGPEMLATRAHINAVGAITPERRELEQALVRGADLIVADSPNVARRLAAELEDVSDVVRLCDVVARPPGDGPQGLTVFKAMGIGLADLAVASLALERARAVGRGRSLPAPQRAEPHLKET